MLRIMVVAAQVLHNDPETVSTFQLRIAGRNGDPDRGKLTGAIAAFIAPF